MRTLAITLLMIAGALAACSREQPDDAAREPAPDIDIEVPRAPIVTVSADQAVSPVPPWQAPAVEVDDDNAGDLQARADEALEAGELFADADAAIPIYLALREHAAQSDDEQALERVEASLDEALQALLVQGEAALERVDARPRALGEAHQVAAVARTLAASDEAVVGYLDELEIVDRAQRANRLGERELNAGRIGEGGDGGALARFRQALELRPGDVRAQQGLAAAESALIRRAETAAEGNDFDESERWLSLAEAVRPGVDTVEHARQRIAAQRRVRIRDLRDQGVAALARDDGLDEARARLVEILAIAPAADPAAAELRQRIDLATHYGLFRPGQVFTDALRNGGRGPEMVVIPHGAFRMGAPEGEADSSDAERPTRNIRFPRGLAVSRHEISVGQYRRFINATGYQARANRRGFSTVYDERSGNLVRRSGVDWSSDYIGRPADDDQPVVHVSVRDAIAYADWLSEQTGEVYRLPSEAEFEYALRAGSQARFPWGEGAPPPRAGNFTGGEDESPSGRRWRNAFEDFGDDAWGPAPVGSYAANAFGLHDMAGNVSEWVADCWHDSYRRGPDDGQAWVNPGCRSRVIRGGSWASSPAQTRSAWRLASQVDTTNARLGFRVVREI